MPYPRDLAVSLWYAASVGSARQNLAWAITHITVRGARQHNLRNVSVSIPRNTLTVVTGLSGSGKSSLAFDTIYAEGQRRYVETLSAYARQFLDQMERPDVDAIDGLSPAISIEQKTTSRQSALDGRDDYGDLRLSAAAVRVGGPAALPQLRAADYAADGGPDRRAHCGDGAGGADHGVRAAGAGAQGRVPRRAGGAGPAGIPGAHRRRDGGADRGDAAGQAQEPHGGGGRRPHHSEAAAGAAGANGATKYDTRRLETSVAKALQMANGLVLIGIQGPNRTQEETLYSSSMACPDCGIDVPRLEPRSFSFNSTYGACPECHGLGSIYDFDPAKTITDWSKPLLDGAMGPGSGSSYLLRLIKLAAEKYKVDLKVPFRAI